MVRIDTAQVTCGCCARDLVRHQVAELGNTLGALKLPPLSRLGPRPSGKAIARGL